MEDACDRRILAEAFPNGQLLSPGGIRSAVAAEEAPLRITAWQLMQFVACGNRCRPGQPADQRPTVQDLLTMVHRWQASQAKTFAAARRTELRIVGSVISNVGTFFAWTTRGFLNHLKGSLTDPVCLALDGNQKISRSGAVIAIIGILSTSAETRNTSGERLQVQLKTSSVLPLFQAYMNMESIDNYVGLIARCAIWPKKSLRSFWLRKFSSCRRIFDDSIEAALPSHDEGRLCNVDDKDNRSRATEGSQPHPRCAAFTHLGNLGHLPAMSSKQMTCRVSNGRTKPCSRNITCVAKQKTPKCSGQLIGLAYWASSQGLQLARKAWKHSIASGQIQHKAPAQPTEILSLTTQGLC